MAERSSQVGAGNDDQGSDVGAVDLTAPIPPPEPIRISRHRLSVDPLDAIRTRIEGPRDALTWACVLEATAPKAGNVFPGRSFSDLRYSHFTAAAELTADWLTRHEYCWSERVLGCVRETKESIRTNVNLGILLLLGPLVAAEEASARKVDVKGNEFHWRSAVEAVLRDVSDSESKRLLDAIVVAAPGGLGRVDKMDVLEEASEPFDLMAAMRLAASRDRIARQYAGGFRDLFDKVVPVVANSIGEAGDLLHGIATAHLRLLATEPDTLIARKRGRAVATEVCRRAGRVDPHASSAVEAFDRYLRGDGNRLNPGTTADLIAAALYILLRDRNTHATPRQKPRIGVAELPKVEPVQSGSEDPMNQASFRVEVGKEQFVFSAAHFITFAGDICERIHGHNYGVRVTVEGPLDKNRYVVDFIALRDAVLEETSHFDHHVILPRDHAEIRVTSDAKETTATFRDRRWVFPNEDCVILPVVNTTAEEIARVIAERVREKTRCKFGESLTAIEVAVDENHGQWGVCRLPWRI